MELEKQLNVSRFLTIFQFQWFCECQCIGPWWKRLYL